MDRKHDPVTKLVIGGAVTLAEQTAALHQLQRVLVGAQRFLQGIPACRRVTDAELGADFTGQAALLQVLNRRLMLLQGLLKHLRRLFHQVQQALAGTRCGTARLFRHIQPRHARQVLHRIAELQALVLHEKADRGAVRAAAKTVIELLTRAHREGGGFFVVERAQGLELVARTSERQASLNDLDDVRACEQVLDKGIRYPPCHVSPSSQRVIPAV